MNRYTQGFLGKKVIYYDNGISMSIEEVLTNLNKLEEVKQSILSEVSKCVCEIPDIRMKNSENGISGYCVKCIKPI